MDDETITKYLQSIARVPMLSREDELKWGYQMVEGRKKITKTIKSKKSLHLLMSLAPAIDEEEQESVVALIRNPTVDNVKLLKEYMVHIDYDILKNYCKENPKLLPILNQVKIARDMLINSNLRLAVSVAKQYTNSGMAFIDLIQEANIGLIKAIDKFDPYRESKLSTLATWWIRQAVIRSLSNKSRTIRIPVHMVDAMNRSYKKLSDLLGRTPTPEEMLAELKMPNLDIAQVKEIMDLMVGPVPLHSPIRDGEDTTYEAFLADDKELFDDILARTDIRKKLLKIISDLPSREEKIIRLKIGL